MSYTKTIMFDVDGVLADFIAGFTKLANEWYGTPVYTSNVYNGDWNFTTFLNKTKADRLWSVIKTDATWWETLPPLQSSEIFSRIWKLQKRATVVFCTHRFGNHAQRQTQRWLERNGLAMPAVVLSKRKGDVARSLDVDFAIDDKPENAACIHWIADTKPCQSVLLDQPYNQDAQLPERVTRAFTMGEFLDYVEGSL